MKNLLLSSLILLTFSANAQSWLPVGTPGCSAGEAEFTSIAIDGSGIPYIVYKDDAYSGKATVLKYIDSSWVVVGSAGFSDSGGTAETEIAIDVSGTPYVAFLDGGNNLAVTVMKYNGTSWVTVGNAGFTASYAVNSISLAIDSSGTPYVAYQDPATHNKATVMKYNGSSWVTVGSAGFSDSAAAGASLAIDGSGTPYVAYLDYAHAQKATVMKYNGSSWVTVGSAGFSAGQVDGLCLAINGSSTPYVAYTDYANSYKATAMKYNGSGWVAVGNVGFSNSGADGTCIAIDGSGTLYVAYAEDTTDTSYTKTTVMEYDGGSWVNVGNPEFSEGNVYYLALALDHSGTPYVAYQDYANSQKATVMRYGFPEAVTAINAPAVLLKAYPNPNNGAFILNISGAAYEDIPVVITDMLGRKVKELTIPIAIGANTKTEMQLDVPTGIYVLSATNGHSISNIKIDVIR